MTVQISAASSADAAVLVLHEERCAQQLSASCTVLTEQDRVKDVLVFSGFMELKFYVGYSFFTAKALFTGEYQPSLCRTWELSQHSMHHLSSRWLMWQEKAVCQRPDATPRALTCLRWICICVPFPGCPERWNVIYGNTKAVLLQLVIFKHCLQIVSLLNLEMRERVLEATNLRFSLNFLSPAFSPTPSSRALLVATCSGSSYLCNKQVWRTSAVTRIWVSVPKTPSIVHLSILGNLCLEHPPFKAIFWS